MENKRTFGDAMQTEMNWGKTWNGADTLVSTSNACLDLFGRSGALREASLDEKLNLILKAYNENPDIAMKILFYTRDIRGGCGERDTFNDMFKWVANFHTESVVKNLWAVLEYGRAKDLYSLIGTKAEDSMWKFMREQFELDIKNMQNDNSVSLLAKWIATPDASSSRTKALGILTAHKLGYNHKTMREYKKKLRALRRYIDVPEAKMATGKWSEIEYSKVGSQCLRKHRQAFERHDTERFNSFITDALEGKAKINTSALTPIDIVHDYIAKCSNSRRRIDVLEPIRELEAMWKNLEDVNKGNVLTVCDTSGSMNVGMSSIKPIEVALALTLYLSERNKGDLKDMFMAFSEHPTIQRVYGNTLGERISSVRKADWGFSTNLESVFELVLSICLGNGLTQEEVPTAIVIISDMQINSCCTGCSYDNRMTFYDEMKIKFENAGYRLPQLVFWNVNALSPSFLAQKDAKGATLISGYSPNVFKNVLDCIGKTPEDYMMEIVNSKRYKDIKA